MPKFVCEVCNTIKEVPTCCNNSMIIKGNLLCCCSYNSKECGYQPIPECCGRKKKIQETDRNAGFSVGGLTKYAINFLVKQRKQQRHLRKIERVGVAAQRLN